MIGHNDMNIGNFVAGGARHNGHKVALHSYLLLGFAFYRCRYRLGCVIPVGIFINIIDNNTGNIFGFTDLQPPFACQVFKSQHFPIKFSGFGHKKATVRKQRQQSPGIIFDRETTRRQSHTFITVCKQIIQKGGRFIITVLFRIIRRGKVRDRFGHA